MAMSIVDSIKRKSYMMPSGVEPSGMTNASNPTSLTRLRKAYDAYRAADSATLPALPVEPAKTMPYIEPQFVNMAESLGICPYEFKAIMTAEFTEDQTLVFTILKKFVAAAKLSSAVDVSGVHQELRDYEDSHRFNIERWEKNTEDAKRRINKAKADIRKTEYDFKAAWNSILIDLKTKLDRNPYHTSLGEWDRLMVMAIAETDSTYCTIDPIDGAKLDFNKCKEMAPGDIMDLQNRASAIKSAEEQKRWYEWLEYTPIDEMISKLWSLGTDFDRDDDTVQKKRDLEWAIMQRSGKRPRYDRHGNIDWHLTFYTDDKVFDDDYGYEEDQVDRLLEIRKALMAKSDRIRKVNSGSGKSKPKK